MHKRKILPLLVGSVCLPLSAQAQDDQAALARQLANPVAALISVPILLNYSENIGPLDQGEQWTLNVQPVIPFSLNDEWNLISRTIFSVVDQDEIFPGAGSQTGLSDTVQSLFFSPAAPTSSGVVWGVGPVFLLPTGTDDLLTTDKWGLGPSAVVLQQRGQWTVGGLVNHIWSVAGDSDRNDISATLIQPFVSFTTPTAWTYNLQTESTYDWEARQWAVPLRVGVSKVTRFGSQLASVGGTLTYWVDSPPGGAEGWAFRLSLTLLYPRR